MAVIHSKFGEFLLHDGKIPKKVSWTCDKEFTTNDHRYGDECSICCGELEDNPDTVGVWGAIPYDTISSRQIKIPNNATGDTPPGMTVTLNCGHCFHLKCVATALEYKLECPNCRAFPGKNIIKTIFENRLFQILINSKEAEIIGSGPRAHLTTAVDVTMSEVTKIFDTLAHRCKKSIQDIKYAKYQEWRYAVNPLHDMIKTDTLKYVENHRLLMDLYMGLGGCAKGGRGGGVGGSSWMPWVRKFS
jgi:hypothetical protein